MSKIADIRGVESAASIMEILCNTFQQLHLWFVGEARHC
jgi:hypothetical protein